MQVLRAMYEYFKNQVCQINVYTVKTVHIQHIFSIYILSYLL